MSFLTGGPARGGGGIIFIFYMCYTNVLHSFIEAHGAEKKTRKKFGLI